MLLLLLNHAAAAVLSHAECTTTGNTFSCNLGTAWDKGDTAEITMPVIATAAASGNVVNRATVTDGNLTKNPEHPVIIQPADPTGVREPQHSIQLCGSILVLDTCVLLSHELQQLSFCLQTRVREVSRVRSTNTTLKCICKWHLPFACKQGWHLVEFAV
jgi:hypothetical protein